MLTKAALFFKRLMAYVLSLNLFFGNTFHALDRPALSYFNSIRDKSTLLSKFSHIEIGASDILKTDAINILAVGTPYYRKYDPRIVKNDYCSLPDKQVQWACSWIQLEFSLNDRLIQIVTGNRISFHMHPLCQQKGFAGMFAGLVLSPHAMQNLVLVGFEGTINWHKLTGVEGVAVRNKMVELFRHYTVSTYYWKRKTFIGRANPFLAATSIVKIESLEPSLLELSGGFKWELPAFLTLSPKWIWNSSGKRSISLAIDFIPFSHQTVMGVGSRTGAFDRPDIHLPDVLRFGTLEAAVEREDIKTVKRLLQYGESPIVTGESDRSVLEIGARTGNISIAEELIKYGGFFANQNLFAFINQNLISQNPFADRFFYRWLYLSSGYRALEYAIKDPNCSQSMKAFLLRQGAKTNGMLDIAINRLITEGRFTVESLDFQIAYALLERGGNINLKFLNNRHSSFERLLTFRSPLLFSSNVSVQTDNNSLAIQRFTPFLENKVKIQHFFSFLKNCIDSGADLLALHFLETQLEAQLNPNSQLEAQLNANDQLRAQLRAQLEAQLDLSSKKTALLKLLKTFESYCYYSIGEKHNSYHAALQKRIGLDRSDPRKEASHIAFLLNAAVCIKPYFEAYMTVQQKLRKEWRPLHENSNPSMWSHGSFYFSDDEYAKFNSIANESLWWSAINIKKLLPREIFEMIQDQLVRAQLMEMIKPNLKRCQSTIETPQTLAECILKPNGIALDANKIQYLKQRAVQLFCNSDEIP